MTKTLATLLLAAGLLAPIAAQADGDAAQGKSYFARCAICHSDTKGAPNNSTVTVVQVIYREAFQRQNLGTAAALSVIVLAVLLLLNALQFRFLRGGDRD